MSAKFYTILHGGIPPPTEDCCICLNSLSSPGGFGKAPTIGPGRKPADNQLAKLSKCGHVFHSSCIQQMQQSQMNKMPQGQTGWEGYLQCPLCKVNYGEKIGNQPVGGTMSHSIENYSLSGYRCETIEITYSFPATGIQGPEHPNPGEPYTAYGFPRKAYLPNNDKGRKALKLLERAFKQRLTFTVGQSVTTGLDNVITWNDIHHKTDLRPNSTFGYPDPTYLDHVIEELKQHGICDK